MCLDFCLTTLLKEMIFKLARFACLILGVWTMVAGVAAVQPDVGGRFVTLDGVKVHPEQILARLRDPAMVNDVTKRMAAKGFTVLCSTGAY